MEILVQCGADPGSGATSMLPVHVTVLNNDLKYCVLDICLLLCGENASVPCVQYYCVVGTILLCDGDSATLCGQYYCVFAGILLCNGDNTTLWGQCCFVVGTILLCVWRNSSV